MDWYRQEVMLPQYSALKYSVRSEVAESKEGVCYEPRQESSDSLLVSQWLYGGVRGFFSGV